MPSKKSLERQYHILLPHLEETVRYMESLLKFLPSKDFVFETNVKPLPSVLRKMKDRGEKNILKLSDLARGRLYYSSNYTEKEVHRLLKRIAGPQIKKTDPKHNKEF